MIKILKAIAIALFQNDAFTPEQSLRPYVAIKRKRNK